MQLQGLEYLELADRLLPAILAAGRLEMHYFKSGVTVDQKSDASPVTIADREAEAILHAALAIAAPGVPVVAEEAAEAGDVPAIGDRFFLVDPLDGTKSFVAGDPDFTVNVALIENRRPTFGVVYAPATGSLFAALGPEVAIEAKVDPGSSATRFGQIGPWRIHTRRPDMKNLAAVASRTHGASEAEAFLARWAVKERRNIGSSLKFCLVARGDADLYPRFGAIREWDTAAGDAVLRAAGGLVTLHDGTELLYGKADKQFKNQYFMAWSCPELATLMT
ncbi:MAG: 3'(2'),5'-bisphosphate nucleotidase CysQ [Hyphomicrobiaceae bacterium]